MSNIAQFMGGSGNNANFTRMYTISGTFVTPFDTVYTIWALGGGGGGGMANAKACSGGGGAGFCLTRQFIPKNTTLTITVGAGGSVNAAGNTTTVSGATVTTMLAGAGGAGSTSGTTVNGGTGGTASGGNVLNKVGGAGGNITFTAAGMTYYSVTGGGGSGSYLGDGGRGGNISAGANLYFSTGGGGVVNRGGDITSGSTYSTWGGTAYSAAADNTAATVTPGLWGTNSTGVGIPFANSTVLVSNNNGLVISDRSEYFGFSTKIFSVNGAYAGERTPDDISRHINPLIDFYGCSYQYINQGTVSGRIGGGASTPGVYNNSGGGILGYGAGTCAGGAGYQNYGAAQTINTPIGPGRGGGGGGCAIGSVNITNSAYIAGGGDGLVVIEF